jgi:hypothetical protein
LLGKLRSMSIEAAKFAVKSIMCKDILMSYSPEHPQTPSPKEIIERSVENEPVGSPVFLAISDHFALLHSEAEILLLRKQPESIEMQQAIATNAQIKETIRNRLVGHAALPYVRIDLNEISDAYWEAYKVPSLDVGGNFELVETSFKIAEAALLDLAQIVQDRAYGN